MPGSSICIVSMNRGETLRQTLETVFVAALNGAPFEIIIVDNASSDSQALNVLAWAEEKGARVIRNQKNQGLSVATNQGFEAAQYDTLIHMDDDVLITHPGWNRILADKFDQFEKVGMIVPGSQSPLCIDRGGYSEITWGLGMCWAIRRSLFEDIGGYDPQLWHQNECDMALRVRMAGYHVAQNNDFGVVHNDPGGPRSDLSLAREHLGCVQFRDKWTSYFRGRDWNYGTQPLYLMQHWPPDQEWLRQFALQNGVNINPPPDVPFEQWPMAGMPHDPVKWEALDHLAGKQKFQIAGMDFMIFRDIRNEYCHWEWMFNPDGYKNDRQKAIDRWFELTGDLYEGYKWHTNLLRPYA